MKAKPSLPCSKIAEAYRRHKGGRSVFLLNGFVIKNESTAVQIFQDILVQRKQSDYLFITAILEEHYVRKE